MEGQNKDCDGREGKRGTLGQGTVLDLKGIERDMKESADKGEQAIVGAVPKALEEKGMGLN